MENQVPMELGHTPKICKLFVDDPFFDRVQEIIADEVPILYLVNPKVLVAVSPALRNAAPSPLPPHLYWNIERLSLAASPRRKER